MKAHQHQKRILTICCTMLSLTLNFLSFSKTVFANIYELIYATNSSGGDAVWKIVSQNPQNDTPLEPGIYTRGATQSWEHQLVKGQILGRENSSGFNQLPLAEYSHRLESWAVIDGKIHIFHLGTTPDKPHSQVIVGDESHPLIDPMNPLFSIARMPLIKSLSDLNVTTKLNRAALVPYVELLVSVKNDTPTHAGMSGVTFVLRLPSQNPPGSLPDSLELNGSIQVLDYHFHETTELNKLLLPKGYISLNFLANLARPLHNDCLPVRVWKNNINSNLAGKYYKMLPLVNPGDNFADYEQREDLNPILELANSSTNQLTAKVVYSLRGKAPQLQLSCGNSKREIWGEVKFLKSVPTEAWQSKNMEDLKPFAMFYLDDAKTSSLISINDELHYFQCFSRSEPIIDIKLNDDPKLSQAEEMSFFATSDHPNEIHILTSHKKDNKGHLTVYKIKKNGPTYILENTFSTPFGFLSREQIKSRIYWTNGRLLFDTQTPIDTPLSAYATTYMNNLVHLDISKSLNEGKIELGFRQAKHSSRIVERVFFNTYNFPGKTDFDGLYSSLGSSTQEMILNGELLIDERLRQDSLNKNTPDYTLSSISFNHQGLNIEAAVVALDKDFQHGEHGFTLVYIFTAGDKRQNPVFRFYDFNHHIEDLEKIIFHGAPDSTSSANSLESFLGSIVMIKDNTGNSANKQPITQQNYTNYHLDFSVSLSDRTDPRDSGLLKIDHRQQITRPWTFNQAPLFEMKRTEEWMLSPVALNTDTEFKKVIYGELLNINTSNSSLKTASDTTAKAEFGLANKFWDHPHHGRINISVYAIDEHFNHGKESFTLVFKSYRSNARTYDYAIKKIPLPFSSLVALRLHTPPDFSTKKDSISIIYALEKAVPENQESQNLSQNTRTPASGFYSHSFTFPFAHPLRQGVPQVSFFPKPVELVLDPTEHPSEEELESKLHLDKEGLLYWPANQFASSHRNFQVISLTDGRALTPSGAGLQLKPLRNLKKDSNNSSVKEGSWRVKKGAYTASKLPGIFEKMARDEGEWSEYKNLLFEDFGELLEDLGNPSLPHQHAIVLVDKAIKNYVVNATAARWLTEPSNEEERSWNYTNRFLSLHYFHKTPGFDQSDIFNNFYSMNEASKRNEKPVLIVDLAEMLGVINAGAIRAGNIEQPYQISYPEIQPRSGKTSDSDTILNGSIQRSSERDAPASLLYILASEGKFISLTDFEYQHDRDTTILLIGTEDEWRSVKDNCHLFERRVLVDQFREIFLQTPTATKRRDLMAKIFEEKKDLLGGLIFDSQMIFKSSTPLSPEETKTKVIDYAVSRSEALASGRGENTFVSYVKLLNKLKTTLDPKELPQIAEGGTLIINKAFIEIMMSDIYGIPLNLHSLPKTDPLKILSQPDALDKLTEAGYSGSFPIKRKVINGILGQTNTGDQRTIPASFILFGKKGSGKTYLFRTLTTMLGLKRYEIGADPEANSGAQVFEINIGDVVPGYGNPNANGNENIPVSKLIQDFDKFIKSPKGKRGFILFDDAHLSSADVRSEIFAKLRSLFEAKDGRYQGVNVRNLTIFMTFNPTSDLDKIKKVVSRGEPTPIQLALATFMSDDNKVDESFFNRWGELINLDYFSTSAKSSELVNKIAETSKSTFNTENRFLTVNADVITKTSNRFPTLNARDFLSSAVRSISSLLPTQLEENPIYLVVPKSKMPADGIWLNASPQFTDALAPTRSLIEPSADDVATYIRQNFHTVIANQNMRGFYYFFEMMTNNFRTNIYRDILKNLASNKQLAGSNILQRHRYIPILRALKEHLSVHPKLPLTEFSFDQQIIAHRLRLSHGQSLHRQIEEMYAMSRSYSYFPEVFRRSSQGEHAADFLTGKSCSMGEQASRLDLLDKYPKSLRQNLERYLHKLLFLHEKDITARTLTSAESLRSWAQNLPISESSDLQREGAAITAALAAFTEEFLSDLNLIENLQPEAYAPASAYEAARIFFYTLDKAITLIQWEYPTIFVLKALEAMAQDGSLANLQGAQFWLFDAGKTLIRPVTLDSILESIKSTQTSLGVNSEAEALTDAQKFYQILGRLFLEDSGSLATNLR